MLLILITRRTKSLTFAYLVSITDKSSSIIYEYKLNHPKKNLFTVQDAFELFAEHISNIFKQNSIGSNFKFCSPASMRVISYKNSSKQKKRIAPFLRRSIFENSLRSHDRPRQLRVFPSIFNFFSQPFERRYLCDDWFFFPFIHSIFVLYCYVSF